MYLNQEEFSRIADFAEATNPVAPSLYPVIAITHVAVSFYSSPRCAAAFGTAIVSYRDGSAVGFRDFYDFDPKAWGERDFTSEFKTRLVYHLVDGEGFNVFGGEVCQKK